MTAKPSPWTFAFSTDLPGYVDPAWQRIPGLRTAPIPGAGVLPHFTHPDDLVKLIA